MGNNMKTKDVIKFLEPQLGYLAKSNGEQLWMHHYTVWAIFKKISEYIPSFDKEDVRILEISCLIHDISKRKRAYQDMFRCGGGESIREGHKPTLDEIKEYIQKHGGFLHVTDDDLIKIHNIVLTHHTTSDKDLKEITTPSSGIKTAVLSWCDHLASMEQIDYNLIQKIRRYNLFDLTYFEVSRFPSPTTMLLVESSIKAYRENGWTPLVVFENGAVFIGKNKKLPAKERINNMVLADFFKSALEKYPIYHPTKNILGGLSEILPYQFLKNRKVEIIDSLNNDDRKGNLFLRLLYDLINQSQSPKIKINDFKKRYKLWNLIPNCLYTSGHKRAKKTWMEYFDEKAPESINSEEIKKLLGKIRIKDLLPEEYISPSGVKGDKYLSQIDSKSLYEILCNVAKDTEDSTNLKRLEAVLDEVILVEEEKDFREITKAYFERYKKYKETTNVSKGLCERCGCLFSMDAKPVLKFKKGAGYGFSQLKARPQGSNATCIFCIYDNMVLREGLRDSSTAIYFKIDSKISHPIKKQGELFKSFIFQIYGGVNNPRNIVKFREYERFEKLLLPKRGIFIPLSGKDIEFSEGDLIKETDTGVIIKIEPRVDLKKFSPKDYKIKYEPLYHILCLLGFNVSIGTEEQFGLFGDNIITTEGAYKRSLAVVLLASTMVYEGRPKNNRFIFSKNLLEQAPSVAFQYACHEDKSKKSKRGYLKLLKNRDEKVAKTFFRLIYESDYKLFDTDGDEYKMKELLDDAKFFAEGIPKFCWTMDDHGKWRKNASKHLITKPISQTMNEILQGNDFEEAIARFMSHIREDIAKDKEESGTITDTKELQKFVKNTEIKLQRYYDLRTGNISKFIRMKNALLSAIYVFKRYPNLKEA